jgi:predicted nucleotidyltransferase
MRSMTDRARLLQEMVSRIREAMQPERIVLFGSRARGTAREDSDFDLLVVKDSDKPRYERAGPLYTKLADLPVEVEIVVYTPEEVREWSNVPQAFITTAMREGKVLYEKAG